MHANKYDVVSIVAIIALVCVNIWGQDFEAVNYILSGVLGAGAGGSIAARNAVQHNRRK